MFLIYWGGGESWTLGGYGEGNGADGVVGLALPTRMSWNVTAELGDSTPTRLRDTTTKNNVGDGGAYQYGLYPVARPIPPDLGDCWRGEGGMDL